MQKIVITIASISMVVSGIILGVLIKLDKIQEGGLLLVAPMVMIGIWLFSYNMLRRGNGNTR
jgi:hypothetical protein